MSISTFNALRAYGSIAARPEQQTAIAKDAAASPAQAAKADTFSAAHFLAGSIDGSERAAAAFLTSGADPHSVIEALASAELAIETAVIIRDKVVEAYQELLRMPV